MHVHASSPESTLRGSSHASSPDAIALSIVSDSRLLCEGLAALLAQALPHCTVSSYAVTEIPEWLPRHPRQIALMDATSTIEQTVRLIRAWRAAHPTVAILTLELGPNAGDILACIEAGAGGYTLRGANVEAVVEAVRLLQRGQAACSLEIAAQVFARLTQIQDARDEAIEDAFALTAREQEVLAYLAADCSNQEIAQRMVIEVRTVKHHVHNILAKLQAHHRWQAVTVARERGLLR
jgi:DNA-binding NarL/FixJ family response regulator